MFIWRRIPWCHGSLVFPGLTAPVLMEGVVVFPRLCQMSTVRSMHRPIAESIEPNWVVRGRVFLPEAASSQHCVGDISPCHHWIVAVAPVPLCVIWMRNRRHHWTVMPREDLVSVFTFPRATDKRCRTPIDAWMLR